MFDGDKIDISRRIVKAAEQGTNIVFEDNMNISSAEGIQYIAMNKGFNAPIILVFSQKKTLIPYLKLHKSLDRISLINVSTPHLMGLADATNITMIQMVNNDGIKDIDMSKYTKMGARGEQKDLNFMSPTYIELYNCKNLETIQFAQTSKNFMTINLMELPQLKSLDLSNVDYIMMFLLSALPQCKISYPSYKHWNPFPNGRNLFVIDKSIYDKPETKDFLKKHKEKLHNGSFFGLGLKSMKPGYPWDK